MRLQTVFSAQRRKLALRSFALELLVAAGDVPLRRYRAAMKLARSVQPRKEDR